MTSNEMARIAYDALDEKLGEDIRIIQIDEISVIADYLIIANGKNQQSDRCFIRQCRDAYASEWHS